MRTLNGEFTRSNTTDNHDDWVRRTVHSLESTLHSLTHNYRAYRNREYIYTYLACLCSSITIVILLHGQSVIYKRMIREYFVDFCFFLASICSLHAYTRCVRAARRCTIYSYVCDSGSVYVFAFAKGIQYFYESICSEKRSHKASLHGNLMHQNIA